MEMKILVVLFLFRYRIGMAQHYLHHIFYNGFSDIGFIRPGFIINWFKILRIDTKIE